MQQFDYQAELKKIIDGKQLVEVYLHDAPTYKVAYILSANNEYLTFAEVSSSATFSGVIICHLSDVDSVRAETPYLGELAKQIKDNFIYEQALRDTEGVKEFTFKGFVLAFENTNNIVELTLGNDDTVAGRIVAQDDKVIALDEYTAENDRRLARTYFNKDVVVRLAIDVPWLRTISRSLADKNL